MHASAIRPRRVFLRKSFDPDLPSPSPCLLVLPTAVIGLGLGLVVYAGRRVESLRELSGTQPEGALMKVTPLPCREVKLLHLATTAWCHTAGMTVGYTTA